MEKQILQVLTKPKQITQIAKDLSIERHTAAKYLEKLESKHLVTYKTKGKSKIYSKTQNSFLEFFRTETELSKNIKNTLKEVTDHISIQTKDFDIIWSNKTSKKGKCYEVYASRKTKCPNCPADKVIRLGIENESEVSSFGKEVKIKPIKDSNGNTIAVLEIAKKTEEK